jgi:hypothetical protein
LDLGLGEEGFGERELSEDRLSNLCSILDKTSIVELPFLNPIKDPCGGMTWRIEEARRGGVTWQLDPPSPLEVRRGIGGEPPPEEGPRLLRLDRREFRLLNEALRLLLEVCDRLTSSFVLLLDLGLGEESFVERELSEDRLSNRCSSLEKMTIVECSFSAKRSNANSECFCNNWWRENDRIWILRFPKQLIVDIFSFVGYLIAS